MMKNFSILSCCFMIVCCLCLSSCSSSSSTEFSGEESIVKEPTAITLNADNFNDYIILDVKIEDFEKETKMGLIGPEYRGSAELSASASLRKDVAVDNVVIQARIVTEGFGWDYNIYSFTLELNKDGEAEYSAAIDSGDYMAVLSPEAPSIMKTSMIDNGLAITLDENEFITSVDNDAGVAIQVSGTIYE